MSEVEQNPENGAQSDNIHRMDLDTQIEVVFGFRRRETVCAERNNDTGLDSDWTLSLD